MWLSRKKWHSMFIKTVSASIVTWHQGRIIIYFQLTCRSITERTVPINYIFRRAFDFIVPNDKHYCIPMPKKLLHASNCKVARASTEKKKAYYYQRTFGDVKCKPLPPHQILCPLYLFQVIFDTQFDPKAHCGIHFVMCDGKLFTYTAGVKAIGDSLLILMPFLKRVTIHLCKSAFGPN